MFANEDDEKADDELRNLLKEKIAAATNDEENGSGGFDAPLTDAPANQTVSAEDGFDLAEKARFTERKSADTTGADFQKTIDAGADKPADKPAGEGTDAAAADPAKPTAAAPATTTNPATTEDPAKAAAAEDITAKPLADLMGALDEPARAEITRRMQFGDEFGALFKGREEELRIHGNITPAQATARLLQINEFAQKNPDEYVAWVATQMKPDAAHTVIEGAAKKLGYKLVPDLEEGDEFEDEATRNLRIENHRLKMARVEIHGPDDPQIATQQAIVQTIANFATERDASGTLVRPHYEALKPQIAAMATEHRKTTGRPVTVTDLDGFYRAAEENVRKSFGIQPTSAAQPAATVQSQGTKTAASEVEKAKTASKAIDGTGQGADRRPALSEDASLSATMKHFMQG